MHLHKLPNELVQNIAFLIVAHDPLGPLSSLLPLLTTSKRIYAACFSPPAALKARIFRLKFDTSSISRRSFAPYDIHLAEQLEIYCRHLRVIKSKDIHHEDVAEILFAIYIMMLDNDGKNFAQLEFAGIAQFVDSFIRSRLWEGRLETGSAGWPLASIENRSALWVAWLTMDRMNLFKELPQARDDFNTLIFPYTLLSPRYPSTEAPPNHFHLPLLPESPAYQRPLVSSSHPLLPPYPHYSPHPTLTQPYFGSLQSISPPLISIAAKLLFTSRKEIHPITIPPVLPPGLRSEDYAEFNKGKAAEVVRGARWDWNRGCAVAVNCKRLRNAFRPRTSEEFLEFEQSIRCEVELIADGDEESRCWDEEWWKRILCDDLKALRTKFPPGLVYKPGRFQGTWQGRLYMPSAEALHAALETYPLFPGYPTNSETLGNGFPTFSEASTSLLMLPVFFNNQEHHRICHCPSYHLCGRDDVPHLHQKACGTVPVPPPSMYPPRYMRWRGMGPHMVVVPPEEVDEADDPHEPEQNGVANSVTQLPTAPVGEPASGQVPLVFGVPSDEIGEVEENPVAPALNDHLTTGVEEGNPNTNAYAYASVAPAPALPPNVNLTGSTADAQPGIQTALPAPVNPSQSAAHVTASTPHTGHAGTHGQGQSSPIPAVQQSQTQQTPPDLTTFLELQRQLNPRIPRLVPTPVDYSMNNAYFPGDVVPSLMFMKRRAAGVGSSSSSGKKRRDEIVFGFREMGMAKQTGHLEWKMVDGRCIVDKEVPGESQAERKEESGQKQLYVYETYDPEKDSVHDASVCKTCKEWEEIRRNERRTQDEKCERRLERRVEREEEKRKKGKERQSVVDEMEKTKMLEACMQDYGKRAGVAADGNSRSSSMDFGPLDSKFGKELLDAVTAAATKSTNRGAASDPSDYESESSDDELSSCYSASDSEEDDSSHSRPRRTQRHQSKQRRPHRLSIFGDDLPHGQAGSFDPHSQTYLPATRRTFDRRRVGAPEGCCGGVRDIIITGETPRRHVAWHRQKYRLYGRVRPWDGMIGLLRVDERSMPGYVSGLQDLGPGLEESEYWSVITNMFICGYIIGGKTFVGEWRMAASDPLKPGWSGPILMGLREPEDGEEPVWEPVGGDAI